MIYAYLRVSTDDQTCQNQRLGVESLAKKLGLTIDKYIIDDGISGTCDPKKRNLGRLLRSMRPGDVLLCSEISRLGRKLLMVMEILNTLMQKECTLYTVKDNFTLGDNIQSKVLAFAFSLVAELERDLIAMRTREALARLKASGVKLGRPVGAKTQNHKLDQYRDKIAKWYKHGWSKAKIARKCHCVDKTLRRYMIRYGII